MNSVCATASVNSTSRNYRFIQPVISPRAGGISLRLNLNPDGHCNFNCVYCNVARGRAQPGCAPVLHDMLMELRDALQLVQSGQSRKISGLEKAPYELLRLGQVALSGDGEPTLSPIFPEVIWALVHMRACDIFGFFRIAVVTNAAQLQNPEIRAALRHLTARDEIWTKLEAGTEAWFQRVNRPDPGISLESIVTGIAVLAREQPVVIQSLFPALPEGGPSDSEQEAYVKQLQGLRDRQARISLVQIYSVSRPPAAPGASHLALRDLSRLARNVRSNTGLPVQVF